MNFSSHNDEPLRERHPVLRRQRRASLRDPIRTHLADGEWRSLEEAAKLTGADLDHLGDTLQNLKDQKLFGLDAEWRKKGHVKQWRVFPLDKPVPLSEVRKTLAPVIKTLKQQISGHMALLSMTVIAEQTGLLDRALRRWEEGVVAVPEPRSRPKSKAPEKGTS